MKSRMTELVACQPCSENAVASASIRAMMVSVWNSQPMPSCFARRPAQNVSSEPSASGMVFQMEPVLYRYRLMPMQVQFSRCAVKSSGSNVRFAYTLRYCTTAAATPTSSTSPMATSRSGPEMTASCWCQYR